LLWLATRLVFLLIGHSRNNNSHARALSGWRIRKGVGAADANGVTSQTARPIFRKRLTASVRNVSARRVWVGVNSCLQQRPWQRPETTDTPTVDLRLIAIVRLFGRAALLRDRSITTVPNAIKALFAVCATLARVRGSGKSAECLLKPQILPILSAERGY
jgi:hypothetical protein